MVNIARIEAHAAGPWPSTSAERGGGRGALDAVLAGLGRMVS
ncbi:hypothetical protein [Actinoplanes xinjiangensis]|uniref:Uncharacterized protein n=1 Tax=Actinoplanes xinjiangensis TaxID=512350 RepID=A0A316FD12_9ACTN|nr:hypothetical protein [Actinoplanes xinjiangensis]PWK44367.1 hypothetical protein BC793_112243 [Actinoplanes xinjiangensis]